MKRNLILYILGVLIFILSIIGLTYAFMKPKVEEKQESTNISINSCAKVQLKDNGNTINLENTYPMDDDRGLETNPYEFTVSSTCEDYIGFNLYLTSLNDNQIEDNNIHFAITSKNKVVLSEGILASQENGEKDFNTEELKELNTGIKGSYKNIYKVYSNNIPLQGESTYQLYLWVDKDAGNDTMGQSFKVGLSVKSYTREETLAEYLIKNKDKTLIYHDGVCDYEGEENCDLEAGDLSYRYSGASNVVNNYICFGADKCNENENYNNLYRIIGLFDDDHDGNYNIKLIKADYTTSENMDSILCYQAKCGFTQSTYLGKNGTDVRGYGWNETNYYYNVNRWRESDLNIEYLNKKFLNKMGVNWKNLILKNNWKIVLLNYMGNNIKELYEKENQNIERYSDYIGLMYINDYGYASINQNWNKNLNTIDYKNDNWLYMGLYEWTITAYAVKDYQVYTVHYSGNVAPYNATRQLSIEMHSNAFAIRPTFYLKNTVKKLDGAGTKENPYRLFY